MPSNPYRAPSSWGPSRQSTTSDPHPHRDRHGNLLPLPHSTVWDPRSSAYPHPVEFWYERDREKKRHASSEAQRYASSVTSLRRDPSERHASRHASSSRYASDRPRTSSSDPNARTERTRDPDRERRESQVRAIFILKQREEDRKERDENRKTMEELGGMLRWLHENEIEREKRKARRETEYRRERERANARGRGWKECYEREKEGKSLPGSWRGWGSYENPWRN